MVLPGRTSRQLNSSWRDSLAITSSSSTYRLSTSIAGPVAVVVNAAQHRLGGLAVIGCRARPW